MKGDFTRFTFNPQKRYTGVRLQQGRVMLDADWNEQIDIDFYQRQAVAATYLGNNGAPKVGGGFLIGPAPGTDLSISPGRFYVNGLLCENILKAPGSGATYLTQSQLPSPPTLASLGAGYYLVYLDVWTRHVSLLEDPMLREVALNGPDTTTRSQTMWQVKLLPVSTLPPTGTRVDISTYLPASNLLLQAHAVGGDALPVDATLPQGTGYQRVDNCLYRVEIHQGGQVGNTTNPVTYKWSRDNGSGVAACLVGSNNQLTISYPGRDDDLGFAIGNWVEVTDDSHELLGQPGQLVRVVGVEGNLLTLDPGVPVNSVNYPTNPKVRRWDMTSATIPQVTVGSWLPLEFGVEVYFGSAGGYCQTGDYWLIPARAATRNIEWQQQSGAPAALPRQGILHAFAPLTQFQFDGTNINNLTDLRQIFPSAIDITNLVLTHGHTGANDGVLIQRPAIAANAIDGTKIDPISVVTMQTVTVSGAAAVNQALTVSGNTALNSTLAVAGASTLGGNVSVAGSSTLNVNGGMTTLGGGLTVSGAPTQLNSNLTVGGSSTLSVGGQTTLTGTLNPAANLTIGNSGTSSTVTVNAALTASNGLTVNGTTLTASKGVAITAGGLNPNNSLTIGGPTAPVTVSGTLNPSANLTIGNSGTTNTLTVNGPTTVNNNLTMSGPYLYLDNTGARGGRVGTYRRALVHDTNDTLTLNNQGDYSNGVQVSGQLLMSGHTFLNDNSMYLRWANASSWEPNGGDRNHGLAYFGSNRPFNGANVDGPGLFGYSGGVLGTINNVAPGVEGALNFPGLFNSGYVSLNQAVNVSYAAGFSIEGWLFYNPAPLNNPLCIMDLATSATQVGDNILFYLTSTTPRLGVAVYNGTALGFNVAMASGAGVLNVGHWQHVAVTIDSNNNVTIYLNGFVQTLGTVSGSVMVPNAVNRTACLIGRNNASNAVVNGLYGFAGKLAQSRLWNRALTMAEVQDHCNGQRPVNATTGLIANWPMDDGPGATSVRDKTGAGYAGSLNNMASSFFESYQYPALTWDSNKNVTVNGTLNPAANLTIGSSSYTTTVNGSLGATGAVSLGSSSASTTVNGALSVGGNTTVNGALSATGGPVSLGSSSPSYGTVVNGALSVGGSATVIGGLTASGPVVLGSTGNNVTVNGTLNPAANLTIGSSSYATTFNGNVTLGTLTTTTQVGGFLGVGANANIAGTIIARSDVTVSGNMFVSGAATMGSSTASTTVNGALSAIGGTVTLGSSTAATTVNGMLNVGGNTTLSGTLNPTSALTMGSSTTLTTVSGPLNVGSSTTTTTVNGMLNVGGNTTVSGTLNPASALTMGGNTTTTTVNGTLTVGANATVNGILNSATNLAIGGNTTTTTVSGTLNVGANATVNGILNPATNLGIGASTTTTSIMGSLNVAGSLTNNTAYVTVACNLTMTGTDFQIFNQGRKASGTATTRRALVHDGSDQLTINYAGDYSGGVQVFGNFKVNNNLTVIGNSSVTGTKSFVIPHPQMPDTHQLVHCCIEGPEAGVYYRGEAQLKNGVATITLPSYFEALTSQGRRTVLLTPCFDDEEPISQLAASAVQEGRFRVRATDRNNPDQRFHWEVKALRGDVSPIEVERPMPLSQ